MHNGIEIDPYFGTGRDREAGETQFPSWVDIVCKVSSPRTRMRRTQRLHTFTHIHKLKTHRPINEANVVPQVRVANAVFLQQLEVLGLHGTEGNRKQQIN